MLPELPFVFYKHRIYPKLILHIGAHRGSESAFYSKYCDGPVVWIEALPKVCASLRNNIAKYPNQRALCGCVSDKEEKVTFRIASNDGQSSSMLDFGSHKQQHPDVKFIHSLEMTTIRAEDLLAQNGVEIPDDSLLVCDVQGVELKAMIGLGGLINKFSAVYCEVNRGPTYVNCAQVEEIDAFFKVTGFERVETWWFNEKASWGDCLALRRKGDLP